MTPPASDRVRAEWRNRIAAEYSSAAITQHFVLWLIQIGASPDLIELGLAIVTDELAHAQLSAEVYAEAGGTAAPAIDRAGLALPRRDELPLEHDVLTAAMQVHLTMVTVRQNEVVKRLAGWGAILALPTMVFSLYGMNFKFMPELDWAYSYPLIMAATAGGCVALYFRLKRVGWL